MADDPASRFLSHRSYVEAIAWLGGSRLTTSNKAALKSVADRAGAAGVASDKVPASIDTDQIARSLRNAWSTELLLALPGQWADEDEFMRLSNSWGVIQAYYVGYHVTQALWAAKGNPRPQSHPKTQAIYASLWVDRPLSVGPWTLGVNHKGIRNVAAGVNIDPGIHTWSGCDSDSDAWSLATKVLRTTRGEAVKDATSAKRDQGRNARQRAWQQEEDRRIAAGQRARRQPSFARPQLTLDEKEAVDRGIRTYTLLDYLWRLRVNANYDDAAVFVDGPSNDVDSYFLHKRVAFIASGMALLAELRIEALVGRRVFRGWADDFIGQNIPPQYELGLRLRRRHL